MQAELLDSVVSSNSQELSNASSATKLFENPQFRVRVIMRCSDPWFVAKDACDCLDLANSRDAVSRLDDDEKGVGKVDSLGGSQDCYQYMFEGCQSLTKAPELPATTLAPYCYNYMFSGCQSLNEVRIAATTTVTNALTDWLKGVSATGDFYCDPNATIFPKDDVSGIPANWNRRNIADYPN